MLVNLHILNIALIDELDISLEPGLNVLTGETGAGKSIIVGSIGIGLGGTLSRDMLRDKDKDGVVELLFSVEEDVAERLRALEIETPDGELLISRKCTGGRTINRINDNTVTLAKLRAVAAVLMALHAQHEQRTLHTPSKHLDIIDSSSTEVQAKKEEVRAAYAEYKAVADKLAGMNTDESERAKRLDFLGYEISEIEAARLKPGEDSDLEEFYKTASCAESIAEITSEIHRLTGYDSDTTAGSQLSRAVRAAAMLGKYDSSDTAADIEKQLSDIEGLLNDFNRSLSDYMMSTDFSEEELRTAEERLDLINSLKLKYARTTQSVEEILEYKEGAEKERDTLLDFDDTLERLKSEETAALEHLTKLSDELTQIRRSAADELCRDVSAALESLNFARSDFEMRFDPAGTYGPNGHDKAEFYISTNVGEDMRPLAEVASGGELSRIMLAIKSTLSDAEDTPTIIFDEIDTGISGITAQRVGDMMKKLSETHQLITITHLPQIAAKADSAYVIEKSVEGDRTVTGIRHLDDEGRVLELARLLGGDKITDSVLESAREMLKN